MDNKYRGGNSRGVRPSSIANDEYDLNNEQTDIFDRYKKNISRMYYRDLADMIVNGYSEDQIAPEVIKWEEKSRKNLDPNQNDRRVMYKTNSTDISDEPLLVSSPIMKSNPKRNNYRSLRKSNSDVQSFRRNDGYRRQNYQDNGQYYPNYYYNSNNNNNINANNNNNNNLKRNNYYYNRGGYYPNSVPEQFIDGNMNVPQPYNNFSHRGKYGPPKSQLSISNNSSIYPNNMRKQSKRNYYNDDNYYRFDAQDQYHQNNYHYKKNYNGNNFRNYQDYPNQNNRSYDQNRPNKSNSNSSNHLNGNLNVNYNHNINMNDPNLNPYPTNNNSSNYRNGKNYMFSDNHSRNASVQQNFTVNIGNNYNNSNNSNNSNNNNNKNNNNFSKIKVIDDDICLMEIPSPPSDQADPIPYEHTIRNSPIVRPSLPFDVPSITHKLDSSTRVMTSNVTGNTGSSVDINASIPNRPGRRAVSEIENQLFEDARKNVRPDDKNSPVQVFSVGTTRTTSKLSANAPVYNSPQNVYIQPVIAIDQQGQYPLYYYPPVDYVPLVTYQYSPYEYPYYNMYQSVYNNYPNNLQPNNTNISTSYPINANTASTNNINSAKQIDQTQVTSHTTSKSVPTAINPIIVKPIKESDIKS